MHDAWWVCARQFMVREDGTYCHQTSIDLRVCQNCLPGARHLEKRQALLRAALDGAAALISPSEAHKALYVANGIAPGRIHVMPNGVRLPPRMSPRVAGRELRFAYVGGNVEVKGFSIVRRAFETLERGDWELTLVDNTLNLGFSSVDAAGWRVRGTIRTVPAYTQTNMDEFFAGVDVLLFPSQWKESFGLTVREALARNVWVIATGGGGPADAIVEGENGNLIPLDGRPEALTQAVTALLENRSRLAGFENPYRDRIRDFDAQARDLHALLVLVGQTVEKERKEAVLF
jgi:glycosyltransferase involved in cell wall biosynthesis